MLDRTQGAGYETCVTPWTVEELRGRLRSSREFLKKYPVPPSEYATLAADATSDDDFVTFYWRRVRDEPGLKVDDFLAYFDEVEDHLAAMQIPVRSEGCHAVDQRHQDIADEVALLEGTTHGGTDRAQRVTITGLRVCEVRANDLRGDLDERVDFDVRPPQPILEQ